MEHLCAHSRFEIQTPKGTVFCRVDVYADEPRHHVAVVFSPPRHAAVLQDDAHRAINAFYRQVLFRHLTPASMTRWYLCNDAGQHQQIQLEGLPGGYTAGQLMPSLTLPVQLSSMTA